VKIGFYFVIADVRSRGRVCLAFDSRRVWDSGVDSMTGLKATRLIRSVALTVELLSGRMAQRC
jgi:hypothetical protein